MPPSGPCTPCNSPLSLHFGSSVPAKAMPPAGRRLAPCTPFTYFFLHTRSHQLKRSGVGRARAVGCLTEPGIVCFSAMPRTTRCPLPKTQGREALRGPRGNSGRPCPVRDGMRLAQNAWFRRTGDASPSKCMAPADRGRVPLPTSHFFASNTQKSKDTRQ